MVTISGANPRTHRAPGRGADGKPHKLGWKVTLHLRLSQPIRAYRPVRVNWTRRELVFVNEPLPVTGKVRTAGAVGIDRGVVHTAADDRGRFYDAPDTAGLDKHRKFHQRRMAKSRVIAACEGRRYWDSRRYQAHKTAAANLAARQARIRDDFAHKLSTQLVREHDFIGIETLHLDRMTRKRRQTGAAAKRGLNRVLQNAAPRAVGQTHRIQSRTGQCHLGSGAGGLHQSALPSVRAHSTGEPQKPSGVPMPTVCLDGQR